GTPAAESASMSRCTVRIDTSSRRASSRPDRRPWAWRRSSADRSRSALMKTASAFNYDRRWHICRSSLFARRRGPAAGGRDMKMTDFFSAQLEREAPILRRVLERVPEGRHDWKPHAKSMPLGYLATLVATMPSWIKMEIAMDELDLNPPGGQRYK